MSDTRTPRPWMCPSCVPHLKALHHPELGCSECECQERNPEGERFVRLDQPIYVHTTARSE